MSKTISGILSILAVLPCSSTWAENADVRYKIPLRTGAITPVPIERSTIRLPSSILPTTTFQNSVTAQASDAIAPNPGTPAPAPSTASDPAAATNRYIIQFHSIPSSDQIAKLKSQGTVLNEYVGGNSYYATTTGKAAAISAQDEQVRAIVEVTPKDKIQPEVLSEIQSSSAVQRPFSVRLFRDSTVETLAAQVKALNGSVIETSKASSSAVILIEPRRIEDLARSNSVKTIEAAPPAKQRYNDLVRRAIGAELLQKAPYGLTGAGVKVGIWDGGLVAQSHEDFKNRLTIGSTGASVDRHATHVAGTLGGDGAHSKSAVEEQQVSDTLTLNGQSASISSTAETATGASQPTAAGADKQWQGVAPGVSIVSYYWDNPTNAHEAAIKSEGIMLSQNSWGYTVDQQLGNCSLYGTYTLEAEGFDQIVTGFYGRRIPIIFAVGNERNDGDCGMSAAPPYRNYANVAPPVTAKNVISVGAINSDDNDMTEFSSWGPTTDGRLKPDIVAPGCRKTGQVTSTVPSNSYAGMCGTSMAAPAVSGGVALLIEQRQKMAKPVLLPSSIKALLIHGASDIAPAGPDYRTGYGAVNLQNSVDLIRGDKVTEGEIGTNGQTKTASLQIAPGAKELKVTLAWDDDPASTNATTSLVNDLDLRLVSPTGALHLPWQLDPKAPDTAATQGADHINVVEQATVQNPEAGIWKIQVVGFAIPKPAQQFSLIVTTR
ncbi:S8 family serine peptidase [Bradyrhizobium niftali]|uniref:Peptidase S8/S53 domain-containing protein n=1 Tax=Bradyrhizobium niftali TaxID=2560055 RepID=A0A4Y9L4X3_9BRAD|nr:S8 family serine peptidase [Bradyrhizobium niftali]TFV37856.1 hypothetical protein E4K65_43135 [Bradyrhizobium niftali]